MGRLLSYKQARASKQSYFYLITPPPPLCCRIRQKPSAEESSCSILFKLTWIFTLIFIFYHFKKKNFWDAQKYKITAVNNFFFVLFFIFSVLLRLNENLLPLWLSSLDLYLFFLFIYLFWRQHILVCFCFFIV